MEQKELYKLLGDPKLYPDKPKRVRTIQTHISFLVLTGKYVYKIKKPVNFGFLDFSTLKKRKHYCEEEIRLNQRLSREIYLGVVAITQKNRQIEISGRGKVVEYAVKMRELPQEAILTNLVRQDKVTREVVKTLAKKIADFHKRAGTDKRISLFGRPEIFKISTDENFEQTREFIGRTLTEEQYDLIRVNTNNFFAENKKLFEKRVKEGRIRECHGDLHTGNIFLTDKLYIFDCIEFNDRFKNSDVCLDVAFIAMDLDYLGKKELSGCLVEQYVVYSKDRELLKLLDFYKCYRAYVRGKVTSFRLNDPHISSKEKKIAARNAKKYFSLSYGYAKKFAERPILFVTCGLTGAGKSYLARLLAKMAKARIVRTDELRKRLARTKKNVLVKYEKGIYSKEMTDFVYKNAIEKAKQALKKSKSCVIDGTFKEKKYRQLARQAAELVGAAFLIVEAVCEERIIRQRLLNRFRRKSVSDGRWEIYVQQKKDFESLRKDEPYIRVNSPNTWTARKDLLIKLRRRNMRITGP